MPQNFINNHINRRLADHYGSRRGFALSWWYRMLYLFGRYRGYRQVDWDSVERLVFVCKGNICRSPYAEAVAQSLGVVSISCGIDTINGAPANADAICAATEKGISMMEHKTKPIQSLMLKKGDLLIAMEPWQAEYLKQKLVKGSQGTLLGLWGAPVIPYIHDPFGNATAYFNNCFNYIEKAVYEITRQIKKSKRN